MTLPKQWNAYVRTAAGVSYQHIALTDDILTDVGIRPNLYFRDFQQIQTDVTELIETALRETKVPLEIMVGVIPLHVMKMRESASPRAKARGLKRGAF